MRTARSSRRFLLIASLLVVGVVAGAAQPTQARRARVPSNCYKEKFEPSRIILSCGNGGVYLSGLTWDSWADEALGEGTLNVNDCNPNCAGGAFSTHIQCRCGSGGSTAAAPTACSSFCD